MSALDTTVNGAETRIREVLQKFWGFDELRPLQGRAINASVVGRDSLVVMPTGGGKSLCYQIPPIIAERTDVVISPLISLMKDQVDGLRSAGYPAAALHSGLSAERRRELEQQIRNGEIRLIFAAPERALTSWFLNMVERLNVRAFAIDEAHCISQWGHDFRPEYRRLAELRDRFPNASFHAFTATATPRVQDDIVDQLHLHDPERLIGIFDRPNLTYRVLPKTDLQRQIIDVLRRHHRQAAIIYCISRADTEKMAATLAANGVNAAHYHAGMEPGPRQKTQEAFAREDLDVVVATVAFGMGIDRSDVRCIIHAAMPKTIEHYQQETGRAGRDGLPAECVMFYSSGDVIRWEGLIEMSAERAPNPDEVIEAQGRLLNVMQRFCQSHKCRHKSLSAYFGQDYDKPNCEACDLCLGDVEPYEDSTVLAQKILSCVARTGQYFGAAHIADVLRGGNTARVRKCKHNELSTYGLLKKMSREEIKSAMYQLIDQGVLVQTPGNLPILKLNDDSVAVMRSEREVKLMRPKAVIADKAGQTAREQVDQRLYDALRHWRQDEAKQRNVPPYVLVDENTLRELAIVRPTNGRSLKQVHGLGIKRQQELGESITDAIAKYCKDNELQTDIIANADIKRPRKSGKSNATRQQAFDMFERGCSFKEVVKATGRAASTVGTYLEQYVEEYQPNSIETWVDDKTYHRVLDSAGTAERLKPIYDRLDGKVSYEVIRAVLAHSRNRFEQSMGDSQER